MAESADQICAPAAGPSFACASPLVSVIVLNYNGKIWLPRCVESLAQQTIFQQTQVIIADNLSTDGSDGLAQELIGGWPNGLFIQNGCNPGFGAGSNLAAQRATGRYLFFLNPDVWLEPDCLQQVYAGAEKTQAGAASMLVLDYADNAVQSRGALGFDFCGAMVGPRAGRVPDKLFASQGFVFIRRDLFEHVGRYDEKFFLYCEELDLSWRIWAAGEKIVHVEAARIHHRGAAEANPKGGTRLVEIRTSDSKRFYANRNHLLALLKNARHVLLLLVLPALALIVAESLAGVILLRRWSFFSCTCWGALVGCWHLRKHMQAERRRIRAFRRRGDLFMLRFFSFRLNRWGDYRKMLRLGLPKVDQR